MKYWRITVVTDLGDYTYESNQRDRDVAIAVTTKETIKHLGCTSPKILAVKVLDIFPKGHHPCGENHYTEN